MTEKSTREKLESLRMEITKMEMMRTAMSKMESTDEIIQVNFMPPRMMMMKRIFQVKPCNLRQWWLSRDYRCRDK
jgi:hypothetical protein